MQSQSCRSNIDPAHTEFQVLTDGGDCHLCRATPSACAPLPNLYADVSSSLYSVQVLQCFRSLDQLWKFVCVSTVPFVNVTDAFALVQDAQSVGSICEL